MNKILARGTVAGLIAIQVLGTTPAYAALTSSSLQSRITKRINSMSITNKTSEKEFEKILDDCLDEYSKFSAYIEDFDKQKSDRVVSGSITFSIVITDDAGQESTMGVAQAIPVISTHVYRILESNAITYTPDGQIRESNNLEDYYLEVFNSELLQRIKDNKSYDTSKYYVTEDTLGSSNILKEGWNTVKGKLYYTTEQDGVSKGWTDINGYLYHLDEQTGQAKLSWDNYNGNWYFLDITGKLVTGFATIDDVTYYLSPKYSGSEVIYTDNMSNALPDHGSMARGWKQISNGWYYFKDNGAMVKGWQKLGSYWYHFSDQGLMSRGTTVDGYKIDNSGVWVQE